MEYIETHEILEKFFFEVHLKKNGNLAFSDTSNSRPGCGE
jgi:hypothetical protein